MISLPPGVAVEPLSPVAAAAARRPAGRGSGRRDGGHVLLRQQDRRRTGSKDSQTSSSHSATRSFSPARRALTWLTAHQRARGELDPVERVLAEVAEVDDLAADRVAALARACSRLIAIFSGRTATVTLAPLAKSRARSATRSLPAVGAGRP